MPQETQWPPKIIHDFIPDQTRKAIGQVGLEGFMEYLRYLDKHPEKKELHRLQKEEYMKRQKQKNRKAAPQSCKPAEPQ